MKLDFQRPCMGWYGCIRVFQGSPKHGGFPHAGQIKKNTPESGSSSSWSSSWAGSPGDGRGRGFSEPSISFHIFPPLFQGPG